MEITEGVIYTKVNCPMGQNILALLIGHRLLRDAGDIDIQKMKYAVYNQLGFMDRGTTFSQANPLRACLKFIQ
ncbi:MAG: hypothetical protein QM642_08955 [Edaphocola sp.]